MGKYLILLKRLRSGGLHCCFVLVRRGFGPITGFEQSSAMQGRPSSQKLVGPQGSTRGSSEMVLGGGPSACLTGALSTTIAHASACAGIRSQNEEKPAHRSAALAAAFC